MAECSFKFNIDSSPAEIIKKVKSKIENEGGSFTGDENDGITFPLMVTSVRKQSLPSILRKRKKKVKIYR